MDLQFSDFERVLIFEQARKTHQATYTKNPLDTDNLTTWAGVLLELSQFQNAAESKMMNQDAISKLEEALLIDPKKHGAMWLMGNAHSARAFFTKDQGEVKECFARASHYFQKALDEDPRNNHYRQSLEIASKGPLLHFEMQKRGFGQDMIGAAAGPSTSAGAKASKKTKSSDLKYDICGWIIFGVGLVAWLKFARSHIPPPPPR